MGPISAGVRQPPVCMEYSPGRGLPQATGSEGERQRCGVGVVRRVRRASPSPVRRGGTARHRPRAGPCGRPSRRRSPQASRRAPRAGRPPRPRAPGRGTTRSCTRGGPARRGPRRPRRPGAPRSQRTSSKRPPIRADPEPGRHRRRNRHGPGYTIR